MDVVVLRPPEGVSAFSPPTTRSPCRPGPRPVEFNPWHHSLNKKKISIIAKKIILVLIFLVFGSEKGKQSFLFCIWHPPPLYENIKTDKR